MTVPITVIKRNIRSSNHFIRQEKEIQMYKLERKWVKPSLFMDGMILYAENPKESTEKILELIIEFSKVTGYKINR